nr:hypothetical protein [Burkholderia cenocepacia]
MRKTKDVTYEFRSAEKLFLSVIHQEDMLRFLVAANYASDMSARQERRVFCANKPRQTRAHPEPRKLNNIA